MTQLNGTARLARSAGAAINGFVAGRVSDEA